MYRPCTFGPCRARGGTGRAATLLVLALAIAGCAKAPTAPPNAILVGALLPFTGDASANGSNTERAILMAAEMVNAAGGIDGRPLWIVSTDTHSDVDRGLQAANDLFDQGVTAIIGPQDGALALQLLPLVAQKQTVMVSGGMNLPPFSAGAGGGYFFRISPDDGDFANVLAQQITQDGVKRFAVVNFTDNFDNSFAVLVALQISKLGGTQVASATLTANGSFDAVISSLSRNQPEAIVLAAPTGVAASFVESWVTSQPPIRFYLTPPLETEDFVRNTPPGALEGAEGVAPSVADDAAKFATLFAQRWQGDVPSPDANYSFDAVALLALAMQSAAQANGGKLSGTAIRDHVAPVSYTPDGTKVSWTDLSQGLTLLKSGQPIQYLGASGAVQIIPPFVVPGPLTIWKVHQAQIRDVGKLKSTYCDNQFSC